MHPSTDAEVKQGVPEFKVIIRQNVHQQQNKR